MFKETTKSGERRQEKRGKEREGGEAAYYFGYSLATLPLSSFLAPPSSLQPTPQFVSFWLFRPVLLLVLADSLRIAVTEY